MSLALLHSLDYDTAHHFDDDADEPRCAHCQMPIYVRMGKADTEGRSSLTYFHTLTLFRHCDAAHTKEATPERA